MSIGSLFSCPQFTVRSSPASESGTNPSYAVLNFSNLQRDPSTSRNLSMRSANGGLGQTNPHGVGDRDGVIIVDHGSRRKESNLMLNEFVDMFRERTGYAIVEPAHMELAEPSIQDAFNSCVEQGANRVIVSPFFLLPGRHWNQDIPSLTAEAAKEHPTVSYMVTAPLGLHPQLVDVMNDRITHCLSHVAGDAGECAVCVGTGPRFMQPTQIVGTRLCYECHRLAYELQLDSDGPNWTHVNGTIGVVLSPFYNCRTPTT